MGSGTRLRSHLIVAGLLALASAPAAFAEGDASAAPDPTLLPYANPADAVRLPDGRSIHMVCTGQGSPVVILTAGAGEWSMDWNKVQPAIARKTRVCAWDRPGFGFSSSGPAPQTVDRTTSDLQAALKAGGVAGPYVAVGHSLGGYESVLLKDRQPSDVVGMVLVDPSVPDQVTLVRKTAPALDAWSRTHPHPFIPFLGKCAAALRAGTLRYGGPDPDGCLHPKWPTSYPPQLSAALDKGAADSAPEVIAQAMDNMAFYMSQSLLDVDAGITIKPDRNFGSMPLIVLTAGEFETPPDFPAEVKAQIPSWQAEWRRGHDGYAALSTRGVNRVVAGSSHYIHQIKPQVVIDAIDEVVDAARAAGNAQTAR
jgi:pimeloyl-ACP methyl ester carboxylesterase